MTPLAAAQIGYRYPGSDRWVLRGVDLAVVPGEVVQVEGRNGSGKSTLLRLLAGFLTPTEGAVVVAPGHRVAYMNQDAGGSLAPDLTVREHLAAFAAPGHDLRDRLPGLLRGFDVGLQSRLDDFVGHLSGGQRQIVALLCVAVGGASVLCLDEFTSAMDVTSAGIARDLLGGLRQWGTALVVVSHGGTWDKADRVVRIAAGGEGR